MSTETGETVGVVNFICSEQAPMGLFRISPGVPCDYALEQASTVLGCVHKLIQAGLLDEDGEMMWAAYFLSEFAKALVDDAGLGINQA
ncbi:DUF3077 domain-containing protein [Pseudomonas auratipiscis]|uniref:DUF3077 domain-containing protein n=1 Tax=Pseudomonas auratipiscis TaxID=3115853 RepID=A0AB35X0Q5_9PSED|nr:MULTISPECIES: DUF3077 domain-containing protein [unclassified Pseudomonas]MEE1868835.1 DUF3077 domain-containing protein [Pseudomonas sp. 120P]MEE1959355.1 DUF3077 domain-containing protein [Pseudomonas sp. 119P]